MSSPFRRLQHALPFSLLILMAGCDFGTLPPGVESADALRLRHLCGDTFQITNRFLRAGDGLVIRLAATWVKLGTPIPRGVTAEVRVPWARSATEAGEITFKLAIPTDQKVQVVATPSAGFPTPSLAITNSGPASCVKAPQVRLRSAIGLGLRGSILPQTDSVPTGSTISWSFTPADGMDGVDVRINGVRAGASGSIAINQETLITAVGTVTHPIPPELVPLVAEARALLTASDPRASAEQLLNHLIALLDAVDEETGDRLLQEFQQQTLSTDADIAGIARLDSLLQNTVLRADPPIRPSLRGDGPTFPAERTTYFVAAGILTTQQKLAATARVVRTLIRERALLNSNDLVRAFVSPSMTGVGKDVTSCIARTLAPTTPQERINGFLTHCLLLYGSLLDGIDFTEATSQILRQWFGGIPPRATSMAFMDSLQYYREWGYHVIINAHSQGTLIAREAIAELDARRLYQFNRDTTCLGVVSMAGPTSGNWVLPKEYITEFATDGDLVAALGGSQATRITTDLSRKRDSAIASVPATAGLLRTAIAVVYALQLHDLQEVYLGETPPRDFLMAANRRIRRECETEELRFLFPGGKFSLFKGEEFSLSLYFQNYNYEGRALKGRRIRLTEVTPPNIAKLIMDYGVAATEIGQATVAAVSGKQSASVLLQVEAPPLLGLNGSYPGTWTVNSPRVSGPYSVTLTEPGSMTPEGQVMVTGTVTVTHPNGTFTVPILDGRVALGGLSKTITFRRATPEFGDIYGYASASLQVMAGGILSGGETLYLQSGGFRETRILYLPRTP